MNLEQYLLFARALSRAAEEPIRRLYRNCSVGYKADGSEVTDADRSAEMAMRKMVEDSYPGHDVIGEEYGGVNDARSEFKWVLDPIDGTTSFVLGVPLFGTLVALLHNNDPIVGVMHLPALNETVYAARGLGCWHELEGSAPTRICVSEHVGLAKSIISTTGVYSTDLVSDKSPVCLSRVLRKARKVRFVGDCVQYGLVCKGNLHAAFDPFMHPWDIAAIVPCVEEAGGVVTSLEGRRDGIVFGGSLLASCDPLLHNEILQSLTPDGHGMMASQDSTTKRRQFP